ncbi:MAG: hypothetical protein Q7T25_06180 [Sideroxyarcus sp.]|nr:hypothetical protein [Sideroxyarcus sp.]
MSVIQLKSFSGEIPRAPAHALPENAAQSAMSCDFAYGELRGIKNATYAGDLTQSPISFWTHDGTNFYTTTTEAEFALSPVIEDSHKRLYYTIGNGTDTRVVSRVATPNGSLNSAGYKAGVPGPDNLNVFGETYLGSSISNAAIYARLINYDTNSVAMTSPAPSSGQSWYPVIAGLTLEISFFYEHGGVKYQEKRLLNTDNSPRIYSAYVESSTPTVPYCNVQPVTYYADGTGASTNIYGRDLHVAYPDKALTSSDSAVAATPAEAIPILMIAGIINGVQVFGVYSEGSSFSSSRGAYGVKLYTNKSASSNVLYCGLKYAIHETRAFVYTHVNTFGEESKPSAPVTVDVGYGQTVELYGTFTQPSAQKDYALINSLRTYGTNATSQGNADWYFVSEGGALSSVARSVSIQFSGAQTKSPADYGERLATQDYDLPDAGTTGLCAMPNGFFAAHRNTSGGTGPSMNELCFTEPYQPHAWPIKYRMSFPWDIVAIKPHGTGLVVTTKGHPYYVYGAHPESMSSTKLQAMQAGLSKRSIVDIGSHVVYASHDGLVAVQNTDVNIEMSQKFFTREKWRELYGNKLSYLALAYHDGSLIGYFTDGITDGFTIRMDEASGTFSKSIAGGTTHCVSPMNDTLYFSGVAGVTNRLFTYASGAVQQAYTWHSKDFIMPAPICMGAGHIILNDDSTGTVTLVIYADGTIRQTVSVSTSGYFRMPSGFMARRWSVKISGGRTVKELYISTSMGELAGV